MAANKVSTLRRKQDFDVLKQKGKRIYPNNWLILNYLENSESVNRFGWTIPNKVGGSVIRNRIKRWCRDYFRSQEIHPEKCFDVNVIVRANCDAGYFKKIKSKEFKELLNMAIKKIR